MTTVPVKGNGSILGSSIPAIPAIGNFPGLPSIPLPGPPPPVGTGPAAARMGDLDGHLSPITTASANVTVENSPQARLNDALAKCGAKIATGCATVYINGLPAARIGDATSCGSTVAPGPKPAIKTFIGRKGDNTNKVRKCLQNASNSGSAIVIMQ